MSDIRQMLGEFFAMDAVANAINKKWSGGYEIQGSSLVFAELWVFQKGAILGRAKADKVKSLAKLVAQEGGEDNMCNSFSKFAEKLLNDYGEEPTSFYHFFMKVMFPNLNFSNIETLKTLTKTKYRLGEILPKFQLDAALGIGFGVTKPELVKRMWVQSYETKKDAGIWDDARKHGLDLPKNQGYLALKEMEEIVLSQVYEFAKENHPELITELGLNN